VDTVEHPKFDVATLDEPPQFSDADVIVFTTKVQSVEEAAQQWAWRPLSGEPKAGGPRLVAELPAVSLSNGLDAERVLLRRFRTVYGVAFGTPARYTDPNHVIIGAGPKVAWAVLGSYPGGLDANVRSVADDLRQAQFLVHEAADVRRWKATKLLASIKFALDLFTGSPQEKATIAQELESEARTAFTAAGIEPAESLAEVFDLSQFKVASGIGVGSGHLSVWQSLVRGSGSEVDFLNGEIVLLARLHGTAAPYNQAIQHLAATLFANSATPGALSTDAIEHLAHEIASV
jgi:2-dehydropantoate 2-reductase